MRVKAKDGLLKQVFDEQYIVEHGQVTPRDKKAIAAGSVQNPNDPEAEYRQKGQQKVKGYSVNITETTDQEDAPSLITGVQVEGATAADNAFYEEAIAKSEVTTGSASTPGTTRPATEASGSTNCGPLPAAHGSICEESCSSRAKMLRKASREPITVLFRPLWLF